MKIENRQLNSIYFNRLLAGQNSIDKLCNDSPDPLLLISRDSRLMSGDLLGLTEVQATGLLSPHQETTGRCLLVTIVEVIDSDQWLPLGLSLFRVRILPVQD